MRRGGVCPVGGNQAKLNAQRNKILLHTIAEYLSAHELPWDRLRHKHVECNGRLRAWSDSKSGLFNPAIPLSNYLIWLAESLGANDDLPLKPSKVPNFLSQDLRVLPICTMFPETPSDRASGDRSLADAVCCWISRQRINVVIMTRGSYKWLDALN